MRTTIKTISTYFKNKAEDRFLKNLLPLSRYTKVVNCEEMGRGVIASLFIPAGTLLGIYPGKYISHDEFLEKEEFIQRSAKASYMFSENIIIDPTDMFGYLPDQAKLRIALINEPPPAKQCNILTISTTRYVWYVTISDINPGEQLFTHYGDQYKRNYESTKNTALSFDHLHCLNNLAKKYSWIRKGVEDKICFLTSQNTP